MYLYDANCSFGAWPTDRVAYETVDELLAEMKRLGIARALVSHTLGQHFDPPQGNRMLMEALAGHEDCLAPCWTLLPLSCGEMGTLSSLMSDLSAANVRAVRLYPKSHSFTLDDWLCGDLLSELSRRRYVVLMDMDETNWAEIVRVCGAYPGISWLITQLGYRHLRMAFGAMAHCANLYFDLSNFSTYLGVEETVSRFDSKRLVFGTGLPSMDPGGPIARVCYTQTGSHDIEAIAHGNLERLLGRVWLIEEQTL